MTGSGSIDKQQREDEYKVSIGGGQVIMDSLAAALDSAKSFGAWPQILSDMVPMSSDALSKLQAPPATGEMPPVAAYHSLARTHLGICG